MKIRCRCLADLRKRCARHLRRHARVAENNVTLTVKVTAIDDTDSVSDTYAIVVSANARHHRADGELRLTFDGASLVITFGEDDSAAAATP